MVECQLISINSTLPAVNLPDGVEVQIGRNTEIGISDIYVSRKQLTLTADYDSRRVFVTASGKSSSKVDGKVLCAGEQYIATENSIIEVAVNSVKYRIVFTDPPKKTSVNAEVPLKKQKKTFLWESINKEEVLKCTSPDFRFSSNKVAAFDLDGTLIKTKSGGTFPKGPDDWQLWDKRVKPTLKELYQDGFLIIIFTNQASLSSAKGKALIAAFRTKMEAVIVELAVPICSFISTRDGYYRKPAPGMWELLEQQLPGGKIDKDESFFCGDAAGRPANWKPGKKKDFANSDRSFALNVKIKFLTPEELFFKEPPVKPRVAGSFDPTFVSAMAQEFTFTPSEEQEVILMVGAPAAGKSHFVKTYLEPSGYKVISRDYLGLWQKCVSDFKDYLFKGYKVVIDNTNPDVETRKRYLDVCKELKIPARCFLMAADKDRCMHNNKYRQFTDTSHAIIAPAVINFFLSNYQSPRLEEGFTEIVVVPFIPNFKDEEAKRKYSYTLLTA